MLVNTQTDLSQFFRKCFFYMGLSMQKFSQTKGFFPSFECKALCRILHTALPIGCLTTEKTQEAWQVFCLVRVVALPGSLNSSKLREAAWSLRDTTVQLMLTESKLGNEARILRSPAAAITSRCGTADVSCKGQGNEASQVCPNGTPRWTWEMSSVNARLQGSNRINSHKRIHRPKHREAFCMMQQDGELQKVLVEDT